MQGRRDRIGGQGRSAVADGGGYLYRPGQLLVEEAALGAVVQRLARSARSPGRQHRRVAGLGVVKLTVRGDEAAWPVPVMARELRAAGLPVTVNHVLQAASHINIRPALPPTSGDRLNDLPTSGRLPGRNVRVGVIDSGVWEEHPWLTRRVQAGPGDLEAADDGAPLDVENGPDGPRLRYFAGHGTFIAGVVLQHAPGATVVVRRVLGGGFIDDDTLAEKMLDLADVDILNLSLGTRVDPDLDEEDVKGLMCTADSLIELGRRNPKLVVVAPAGNDGQSGEVWPAAFKAVVSVAALDDAAESRAAFSNYGDWVDAGARGEDVRSTFLHWNGLLEPPRDDGHHHPDGRATGESTGVVEGEFEGWACWSGTSFATPRVAAAIASTMSEGADPPLAVAAVLSGDRRVPGCGVVVDPPGFA